MARQQTWVYAAVTLESRWRQTAAIARARRMSDAGVRSPFPVRTSSLPGSFSRDQEGTLSHEKLLETCPESTRRHQVRWLREVVPRHGGAVRVPELRDPELGLRAEVPQVRGHAVLRIRQSSPRRDLGPSHQEVADERLIRSGSCNSDCRWSGPGRAAVRRICSACRPAFRAPCRSASAWSPM